MEKALRVVFAATNQRGGFRLRSSWPAEALQDRGWNVHLTPGWPGGLDEGDVVIIHRPLSKDIDYFVEEYRAAGIKVLVDEDDDINCIPPMNEFQATQEQLERHEKSIREADGLIVTSDRLIDVFGPLAKRTFLVKNAIPAWVEERAMPKPNRDGKVRVGWAGTLNVHRHDILWIQPFAEEMCAGAVFTSIGDYETPALLKPRCEVQPFGYIEDALTFYRAMSWADVGIVPLEPSPFNEAKSWLKSLEYMTLGIPVVATDLTEHRWLIEHGKSGYLAKTPQEFAQFVQILVNDGELRAKMGRAALERAREFSMANRISDWETAISEVAAPRKRVHAAA